VVRTGTEKVQSFDLRGFLFQRDLRTADELFHQGAFYAAARLLKGYPHAEALRARESALCLHEWQRMNYAKAAIHAAKFSEALRLHLKALAEADAFGVSALGDLLAGADELLQWGDCEEALARYYRGAEQAAKVRLADAHSIRPPYRLETVIATLPAGCRLADDLRRSRPRNGEIFLTAQRAWDVLDVCGDPMAASYFDDKELQQGLQRRNESMYGHGQEPVEAAQVHAVCDRLRNLLGVHLPAALACWTTALRPRSLDWQASALP
jgi:tetratricopeptide (TPR) repeat protein